MKAISGVCPVMSIPFRDDGAVDLDSLRREVDFHLALGVNGLVLFGLGSEVYKLTDDERREIGACVVRQVDGRVPVTMGAEHTGTEAAAQRSHAMQELGADALMLYPPSFVKPGPDGILEYYQTVSERVRIPIVVQDAEAWTGVRLTAEFLVDIARTAPRVKYAKIETLPTGPKASRILTLGEGQLAVLGGFAGIHYLDERQRGVSGTFIGAAAPDIFLKMDAAVARDDWATAEAVYNEYLPYLVFALTSLDAFNEIQKRILHRAGIFRSAHMRAPHTPLDAGQCQRLDHLLQRLPMAALHAKGH